MDINKVLLIGRLTHKPKEWRVRGEVLASFRLETTDCGCDGCRRRSERLRLRNKKRNPAQLHNVVVSGSLASIALNYLAKSSRVYIEGRLTDHRIMADEIIVLRSPTRTEPPK